MAGGVDILEPPGLVEELIGGQQLRQELHPSSIDPHPEFTQPGQQLLLDLAGHAGLLGARMTGRVGIGIGREGPIVGRRLAEAEAGPNPVIGRGEFIAGGSGGGSMAFLHCQEKLGHHVPIDAAQPLEGEKAAAAARELPVMKHFLPEFERRGTLCRRDIGLGLQPSRQIAGAGEVGLEMSIAGAIDDDHRFITPVGPSSQLGHPLPPVARQAVAVEERPNVVVGLEQIALLVGAVERAAAQPRDHILGLPVGEQPAREGCHLPFEHRLEPTQRGESCFQAQHVIRVE